MVDFERDYLLRLIKNAIRGIAHLLVKAEQEERKQDLRELFDLIDSGRIDEAENRLFACTEILLPDALRFYDYLNAKDDSFLAENGFRREEILSGLRDITARYGMADIAEVFFDGNADL